VCACVCGSLKQGLDFADAIKTIVIDTGGVAGLRP